MDKQRQQHQENANGSGFFLGVIVGVLLTLLFTTKRGREILHDLTEKGFQKFSDLEKISKEMNEKGFEEEVEEEESADYQKSQQTEDVKLLAKEEAEAKEEKPASKPKETPKKEEPVKEEKKSPEKSIVGRRWFRGSIKKKS
jgi:gas vesicle protein